MNSLQSPPVSAVLTQLFNEAEKGEAAIRSYLARSGLSVDEAFRQMVTKAIQSEKGGMERLNDRAEDYFAVSRDFGKFLYAIARACRAKRIVEFGTSMGVSTIHLAAAIKDNAGGEVIGSEFVTSKAARARASLKAAGLADLVDIRVGDARQTLRDIGGEIDMLLLDGAFTQYLEIPDSSNRT